MHIAPIQPDAQQRRRVTVMQGMAEVASETDIVLTTVLGSCIAACLYDPVARIGGMNHYLLAEPRDTGTDADSAYGIYLMELLINSMMKRGASKARMKAHVYGGANIHRGMRPIGTKNAELAERFLNAEGIMITNRDTGGSVARRVDFLAASGKARCRQVDNLAAPAVTPPTPRSVGDVEFF